MEDIRWETRCFGAVLAWFSEHIDLSTREIDYYNVSNSEHTEFLPACYKNGFVNFKIPMNFP